MPQHATRTSPDNPYLGIVYDRLGDPVPATSAERMQCYVDLLNRLQSRLADGRAASAESRTNLALLSDAIALVEQKLTGEPAAEPEPARPVRPAPAPANEDRPPPRRRRTPLSFGGYLATTIVAALVSIATYFAIERWPPAATRPAPASITLIDALAAEVADRDRYDAYFGLMARLEKAIAAFKAERGVYPTTRDKAFLAVSSVDLFKAQSPDPVDRNLWTFWESLTYASDGTDFKLISVGLGTCAAVRVLRPEMLDPKRSQHPFDCLAFGVWTAGARDF